MRRTAAVSWLGYLLGLALGGAFFYAGLQKRLDAYQFAEALLAYELIPLFFVGLVAAVLPWLEITSGFFLALGYGLEMLGRLLRGVGFSLGDRLVGGIKRQSCLLLIILQLVLILVVLFITVARGLKIDCGCGLLWAQEVGWAVILEDCFMLALAGFLYWWELPFTREALPQVQRRIEDFRGHYQFLSNSAPAPVSLEGVEYPTVEHAYQAAKTLDPGERQTIRSAATPGLARKLSRNLTRRPDWEEVKVEVMKGLVWQKFHGHPDLRQLLLATGEAELVEGNTWHDNFWGKCHCSRCAAAPGENWLGRLLMKVRDRLRAEGAT